MAELAPIIHVTRNAAIIRTAGGNLTIPHSEPSFWSVTLDNSTGLYNPSSAIAAVRANEAVYCKIHVATGADTWASTELIVEDYDYSTDTVSISGRCRLAQLDRDDQVILVAAGISTAENMTVAAILTLVATHCGLTVIDAPIRNVKEYHLVGKPLEMFRDLLEPTHGFRMSRTTAGQIEVFLLTTHAAAGTLADAPDLEILSFRRSTEIYNKATVERIVQQAGAITLFHKTASQGSGSNVLGTNNGDQTLDQPSRQFRFEIKNGYRGSINSIVLLDSVGNPTGQAPFEMQSYTGTVPVYGFRFNYQIGAGSTAFGPYTANWEIKIIGLPLTADPVPQSGYSATAVAGAGHRPYPEPFSSISINTNTEAMAAATALVEQGTRIGNILSCSTRCRANYIWQANDAIQVVDADSGINVQAILEAMMLAWDEDGDTGTLTYDCTITEVA